MKSSIFIFILFVLFNFSLNAQQVQFLHPEVIEMGKIAQGGVIEGAIEFKNIGTAPVEIEEVKPSCGCTAVTPDKMVYNSGEIAKIPFSIKTEGFQGVIRKSIRVTFKNAEPKDNTFYIQANIIADINLNPRFINFPKVALNPDTTVAEFFEIENGSDHDIEINKIYPDNDFLKVSPETVTIPAGKSQLIRVEFKPDKVGRHNTTVVIESKEDSEKTRKLPVFINVSES
jgi:hypothetical protein